MRFLACLLLLAPLCGEGAEAVDDAGNVVRLDSPPGRIVSLAPHLTEILFALEAGPLILATVEHSDYPAAARAIPRLGDAFSLSVEKVLALSPDLILAWRTGGAGQAVARLQRLGYPVYLNEAGDLEAIATTIERLALLLGVAEQGARVAGAFRASLEAAREAAQRNPKVDVFFQIADSQLYTVNDGHLIGQALKVCNANNLFGGLAIPVPLVSLESIVAGDPERIIVAVPHAGYRSRWAATWEKLGWSARVRETDASLITRPGPRMAQGIQELCRSVSS